MLRSLVGSEMCIRDSGTTCAPRAPCRPPACGVTACADGPSACVPCPPCAHSHGSTPSLRCAPSPMCPLWITVPAASGCPFLAMPTMRENESDPRTDFWVSGLRHLLDLSLVLFLIGHAPHEQASDCLCQLYSYSTMSTFESSVDGRVREATPSSPTPSEMSREWYRVSTVDNGVDRGRFSS
eukprot:TRINITY_DN6942_c0_g1_i11.p1 TRINITY_DN6942_c0_g1~~TRINITY_DN6942_c0_g1_i11.p1  ORF type:complete len:182 (+),score=1.50 TRINITY_DN6942_c0_g1_i11:110-655(+)